MWNLPRLGIKPGSSALAEWIFNHLTTREVWVSLVAQMVKNAPALQKIPRSRRCSREGNGNLLQYSYLENPHGQRSLVGYSPWGCKESDTTPKELSFLFVEGEVYEAPSMCLVLYLTT